MQTNIKKAKKTDMPSSIVNHFAFNAARTLLLAAILLAQSASVARADAACRTPDGFSYQIGLQKTPAPPPAKDKGKDGKGVGGTGITADRGLGGTGIDIANGKGLGGTGIRYDEGLAVQGRITGFGSICINGLEIKYSAATTVQNGPVRSSTAELRIGEIVSVLAVPAADGLMARSIAVNRLVAGRLTSIDTARGLINVAGQTVIVPNIDKVANRLVPGSTISVSGFRTSQGSVVATYIDRHPAAGAAASGKMPENAPHVAIQGLVTRNDSAGVMVGDTKIMIPEGVRVTGGSRDVIRENDRLIVIGRREGGSITADVVSIEHHGIAAEISADRVAPEIQAPGILERRGEKSGESGTRGGGGEDHGSSSGRDGGDDEHASGSDHGAESPEIQKPEVEKPEVEKPEVEKPEIEKPEIEKPEIEKPEIEKPEIERPEGP